MQSKKELCPLCKTILRKHTTVKAPDSLATGRIKIIGTHLFCPRPSCQYERDC